MARRFEWLGPISDGLNILVLLGIPMSGIIAIGATVWGHIEQLRLSYLIVLLLVVFALTLWSWIGIIWLIERAKGRSVEKNKPSMDCAWGLIIEGAVLRYDAGSKIERQLFIALKNRLQFPVKLEIVSMFVEIENMTPDVPLDHPYNSVILMPGPGLALNFPGYSKGKLPEKERIKGKIDIIIKYGHPDFGYTRIMSRWLHFDQVMKPSVPDGMFPGIAMMPLNQVALNYGPYKEDEDKPYVPLKP